MSSASSRRSVWLSSVLLALAVVLGGASIAVGLAPWQLPGEEQEYQDPTQYPTYYASGPTLEGYHFTELPLDPESVFYPSSASTRSGGFYSQEQLMDVERCGDAGCHPDIYDMWFESTHHLASMSDPWYQRTVRFVMERSGTRVAQWCGGCHDPALMMTGQMQEDGLIDFDSAEANVGLTCQFCHSVDRIDPAHANGSFRLAPAAALPYAGTTDPELRAEGNRMLLEDPDLIRRHRARRRSPFHVMSEFCGTCHKQSLITPVNNYKWFRGFDEFDGWQDSGVSGAGARSFYYPEKPLRCQDCHMPEVPSNDAGSDNGYVNSHRFLGSNTALPAFHGYDEQLRKTVEFLQDGIVSVDLLGLELATEEGTALVAPMDSFAVTLAPGAEVGVEVVVRTRGVGHLFTGGTTDSNLSWLEISLLDQDGEYLLMSGGMDEERFIEESAHSYRGLFLDEAGQELDKRNGWDRRTPVYVHQIPPGAADTVHYRFEVPEGVAGELTLRARLVYRKHKQQYNRWALGATPAAEQPPGAISTPAVDTRAWEYDDSKVIDLPSVVLAEDEVRFAVSGAVTVDGAAPDAEVIDGAQEHWMRFNDYGIGLLRQGDLRGALREFRRVQAIHPEYADAWVNEARAHLQEGNLPAAEEALATALEMNPGWFKASYFMAQVARGYGEYERAVELLELVLEDYPYDRVARVDLGNVLYLMGRHEEAIPHLLFVLDNIDPEELGSHYNLMLTYRAMGDEEKAAIHESRYLRYKEDEDIRQLTGPYKRARPAVNNEAQPIHGHELLPPEGRYSAPERFPWTEFLEGGRYWQGRKEYPGPLPPWRRTDRPAAATGAEREPGQ